ncbi:hypothetical protein NFI96_014524, partial [Prochilodus magdalenae]
MRPLLTALEVRESAVDKMATETGVRQYFGIMVLGKGEAGFITVKDFLDLETLQNDNAPAVIYPSPVMGSVSYQRIARSAKAGHLVTKVTAGWTLTRAITPGFPTGLAEATDASLFSRQSPYRRDGAILDNKNPNREPGRSQLNTDGPIKYGRVPVISRLVKPQQHHETSQTRSTCSSACRYLTARGSFDEST